MLPLIMTSKACKNCSSVMTPFFEESNLINMISPISPLEWKKMSKVYRVKSLFLQRWARLLYMRVNNSNYKALTKLTSSYILLSLWVIAYAHRVRSLQRSPSIMRNNYKLHLKNNNLFKKLRYCLICELMKEEVNH
jgi:hypothetical protein